MSVLALIVGPVSLKNGEGATGQNVCSCLSGSTNVLPRSRDKSGEVTISDRILGSLQEIVRVRWGHITTPDS